MSYGSDFMIYYILISIAALMFSLQFICQQSYEKNCGTALPQALLYALHKGLSVMAIMLVLSAFSLEFTTFSFLAAAPYSLCYILMIYFSLKAFSVANLSVYSVFTMLGGMTLPFLTGVFLFGEKLSVFKVVCFLLVAVAVAMNIQKGSHNKKAFLYYILVFILNGAVGAISTIHQNIGLKITDSTSFLFYSGVWTVLICGVWLFAKGEKVSFLKGKNLLFPALDGFFNGCGDLLMLISVAPGALDASVLYPFGTGGVMLCSVIISTLRRENVKKIEYIAAAIAFVASVFMAF